MLRKVMTPTEIHAAWKSEGREYRAGDVSDEYERQGAWLIRQREDAILAAQSLIDPNDDSIEAQHSREVAGQIRDHRSCGSWTTQRRKPAPTTDMFGVDR